MAVHTITLIGYRATSHEIVKLGTAGSYGLERIRLVLEGEWQNYSIMATFIPTAYTIDEPPDITFDEDMEVDVPQCVTSIAGDGTIVFAGIKEGVQCITCDVPYQVEAHAMTRGMAPIRPSGYAQIVEAMKAANAAADKAQESAEKAAGYANSVRPETIQNTIAAANESTQKANAAVARVNNALAELNGQTLQTTTVYCWGDSLTEGVGGWLTTTDGNLMTIVSAYPDVVGRSYNCVNLGCRGETIQTIMARQGADPMVVGGFTIPASAAEDVVVGYLRGNYYAENRLGLATASGDLAQPLKECEAGVNPCTIGGVEGTLYRDLEKDSEDRYAYRFRRLEDGEATEIAEGTTIETHAMKHYRNGVAVIWMGANGAVNSHAAYIQKIRDMVEYGQYQNYVVLVCREYAAQWVLEDSNSIEKALTDEDGTCHLLYLYPELVRRGYTLAGIAAVAGFPDTSGWTNTTDEIKLKCPMLMSTSGVQEANYETLHFSAYGYKAIGKLVVEKLDRLLAKASAVNPDTPDTPDDPDDPDVPVTDDFGTMAYRLATPAVFTGTNAAIDTGWAPFDNPDKDWTVAIKYSSDIDHLTNQYNVTLCHMQEGTGMDATANLWLFSNRAYYPACDLNFIVATGTYEYHQQAHGNTVSDDGYHYAIVTKNGANASYYIDGYHIATQEKTFDTSSAQTLYIGGASGETGLTGTIAEVRIYSAALTQEQCVSLTEVMATGTGGSESEDPGYVTDGTDDYGSYAYKLTRAMTGTGEVVNTGFQPYDVEKDWTIVCRFADDMTLTDGSMGCVFEMREYFAADSRQTAVYLRKQAGSDGTVKYGCAGGFGGFNFPYDNAPGYAASEDGYHYVAIIKNAGNFSFYLDGGLAYGAPLGYAVAEEHLSEEPLRLFGRVENGNTHNTITGEISDFRIYNGVLDKTTLDSIWAEMATD